MPIEVTPTPEYGAGGPSRVPKSKLGKDDFLLLLTQQLKNQDPLKPMENTEFVSQMATFSSLEQMTNMNKNLEKFITNTNESYKLQALGLLGKTVTAKTTEEGAVPATGVVQSVAFVDGEALIKVGDKNFKMPDIIQIENIGA